MSKLKAIAEILRVLADVLEQEALDNQTPREAKGSDYAAAPAPWPTTSYPYVQPEAPNPLTFGRTIYFCGYPDYPRMILEGPDGSIRLVDQNGVQQNVRDTLAALAADVGPDKMYSLLPRSS